MYPKEIINHVLFSLIVDLCSFDQMSASLCMCVCIFCYCFLAILGFRNCSCFKKVYFLLFCYLILLHDPISDLFLRVFYEDLIDLINSEWVEKWHFAKKRISFGERSLISFQNLAALPGIKDYPLSTFSIRTSTKFYDLSRKFPIPNRHQHNRSTLVTYKADNVIPELSRSLFEKVYWIAPDKLYPS